MTPNQEKIQNKTMKLPDLKHLIIVFFFCLTNNGVCFGQHELQNSMDSLELDEIVNDSILKTFYKNLGFQLSYKISSIYLYEEYYDSLKNTHNTVVLRTKPNESETVKPSQRSVLNSVLQRDIHFYNTYIEARGNSNILFSRTFYADEPEDIGSINESGLPDINYAKIDYDIIADEILKPFTDDDLNLIISNSKNYLILKKALLKISNLQSETLQHILNNIDVPEIKKIAVRKIKDQALIMNLVMNSKYEYVREEAVKKVKDQDVLISVVKNDTSGLVRKAAVDNSHLINKKILADVVKNENEDHDIRYAAMRYLLEPTTPFFNKSEDFYKAVLEVTVFSEIPSLIFISENYPDKNYCRAASALLADIAKKEKK